MEAINKNEKREQPWGTLTVKADVQISGTWGLTNTNLERVKILLSQYPELAQQIYVPGITLPAFRFLIRVLGQDDFNLDRLNESVDTYFQEQSQRIQIESSPTTKILQFNGKWILVAGTGDDSFNSDEQLVSETLGRLLAERGFGLIGGGWPGVDAQVARSFAEILMAEGQEVNQRLVQLLEPNQHSVYEYGSISYTDSSDWNQDAAERSDALVMIGGKGGTYGAFESFHRMKGKSIVPISATGGDAQRAFDQMSREGSLQTYDPNWPLLEGTIGNTEQAENICKVVLHLLMQTFEPLLS